MTIKGGCRLLATPISKSNTPLVFDALPALKVRHYQGVSARGNIYTLARLYVLGDALALSLCAFEKNPPPESRVGFGIGKQAGPVLVLALSPKTVQLRLTPGEESLPPPEAAYFAGQDEQGWYWGANLNLEPGVLAKAGVDLAREGGFWANLAKYRSDETAFGSAFMAPHVAGPFSPAHFGKFQVVEY